MTYTGGFEILSEELIHEGPVVTTHLLQIRTPDLEQIDREVTRHPGAVAIVAVDGENLIMLRQFRAALGEVILELPAGKRDVPGEPPEVTANRELVEEIGYEAATIELLGEFINSPGFCDERCWIYLGTDLSPAERSFDGAEEAHMEVVRVPLTSVPDLVAFGGVEDAKTLIGLQWLMLKTDLVPLGHGKYRAPGAD